MQQVDKWIARKQNILYRTLPNFFGNSEIFNFRCHYSSQIPTIHHSMPPPPPPPRSPGFYPFPNIHQTTGTHPMEPDTSLLTGHHQVSTFSSMPVLLIYFKIDNSTFELSNKDI